MANIRFALAAIIILIACFDGKKNAPNSEKEIPVVVVPPDGVEHIRNQLTWKCPEDYKEAVAYLNQLGEKRVFAAFEVILSEPRDSREVANVFGALRELRGDRSRFLQPAIHALANPNKSVRFRAIQLLEVIGTATEASPLVAALSDSNTAIAEIAANTLEHIGGPREVLAMEVWLQGDSHRNDGDLRQHVKECRDRLRKRLDQERAKQKD